MYRQCVNGLPRLLTLPDDPVRITFGACSMQIGYAPADWEGKPIIAIVNTWSDAQPCHLHFKHRVDDIKRGVLQAGGFPMELPALSLSENFVKPTTMLYRNFLAMETEELLRSHPIDGAVLMGGCDKTTPGLVMGALSMGIPFIYVTAGPMLRGNYKGNVLGSGTDGFKFWDERRAGTITKEDWVGVEGGIARSYGHCMTMGTASTMTAIAEALGLTLPGASSIPAADANHQRMCAAAGRRIVDMVWEDLTPDRIVTAAAVLMSVVFLAFALGGVSFMKLFGLGLTVAVLLDAFVIRGALVPAFMRLAGDWNWWAPAPLRRVYARWGISEHVDLDDEDGEGGGGGGTGAPGPSDDASPDSARTGEVVTVPGTVRERDPGEVNSQVRTER